MILSYPELRRAVSSHKIKFEPEISVDQIQLSSIELTLGNQFTLIKKFDGLTLQPGRPIPEDIFEQRSSTEPFILEPDKFVLAMTHERVIMPNDMAAFIEGRSTYARFGLSIHATAPLIEPGWTGQIALEIKNDGPNKLCLTPWLDRVSQLIFFKLSSSVPKKITKPLLKYANQKSARPRTMS